MVAPTGSEEVRYDILIEAKAALASLREMLQLTESNSEKVVVFSRLVQEQSKAMGVSWQQLLAVYKQLNAELSQQHKATVFGNTGGQDLFPKSEQYLQTLEDADRLQTDVGKSAVVMGDEIEQSTGRAARGIDVVRIALGTLVAMLVFQVMQAVQNTFRMMIDNTKEAELALYNLINAERRLSQEGIDVTPKGLQETIDAVQKLVPILSKIQAGELVSRIATNVAPALRLNNDQIKQLTESVALLYIRNKALGKSFDEVEAQVTNAFLTGKVSQGINQLGVKITDQIVKDEALRLGLVKTEKEFDNLSGEVQAHVKSVAMLSVVYKNAKQDMNSVGEYMGTLDAQSSAASKAWSDFLTVSGRVFGPLLAEAFKVIAHGLEVTTILLEHFKKPLTEVATLTIAWMETMRDLPQYMKLGGGKLFESNFKENLQNAQKLFQDLADAIDTPTSALGGLQDAADSLDVTGLKQKIDDIIQSTNEGIVDLRGNLLNKLSDINLKYERQATDAETDYYRKIEDINRNYADQINEIKKKQREQDKNDEAKYQLALWELQQKYLMNLEDALHARDARQVLRLTKQYALDKETLRRKHELDNKQKAQDQKDELDAARKKRDQELADAKLAYQRKLEDQRIAKQRELADLQTWYMRELQDLQTAQQRKLQTLIKGWVDEQKITQQNAAAVYAILKGYFGPGGMTDQLYQYMMQSLAANTQNAINSAMGAMSGSVGGRPGSGPSSSGGGTSSSTGGNRNRAEGGAIIASRATNVTFGEKGAEAALFVPLTRLGKNAGRVDFNGGGSSGMGGQIVVQLNLSPDLEARVVESSLNGVADIVTKINRSKY